MKRQRSTSTPPRRADGATHRASVGAWRCAFGFTLVLLLAGCAVGPRFKRPATAVPAAFRGEPPGAPTNSLAELPWWDVFKDPTLKALLRTALTNNYDVRIAIARMEQARALEWENRALFFPQLGYAADAGRGRNAAGNNALFNGGHTANTFFAGFNASWELDFWGRIRRLNEAAQAQYLASREAQRAAVLTLISQVAQDYFRLLALDALRESARRTTNSFQASLRIFSQRLEQGVVSKLETAAAEAALDSAEATVPDLERQLAAQENLLNLLLGRPPGPVPRPRTLSQEDLSLWVPPGLPSTLLEQRPDIREAEENFRAANAQVGVAVANFFPQFSLTGLFGQVSPELSAFTSGAATAWSAGAQLAGPLFQGGRFTAQYRQARAACEEARLRYQSTVLNALREVADDLSAVRRFGEARDLQARAVHAYEVAVQVALERYTAGRASYYEVLQEQQLLFPAENALIQAELNQFLAFIQLYEALGGGFGLVNEAGRSTGSSANHQ